MKKMIGIGLLLCGIAATFGLPGEARAALFLDSWGVDGGSWAPQSEASDPAPTWTLPAHLQSQQGSWASRYFHEAGIDLDDTNRDNAPLGDVVSMGSGNNSLVDEARVADPVPEPASLLLLGGGLGLAGLLRRRRRGPAA